jgi:hypothetical protein
LPDDELLRRIEEVVSLWGRQAAGGMPAIMEACARLIEDDQDLRDDAYQGKSSGGKADWWRAKIREAWPAVADVPVRTADTGPVAESPPAAAEPGPGARPVPRPVSIPPWPVPVPPLSASVPSRSVRRSPPRYADPGPPVQSRPAQPPGSGPADGPGPLPFGQLSAEQGANRVILRWQRAGGSDAATFTVERLEGPGVARRRWRTSDVTVEDVEPPAGRPLVYQIEVELLPGTDIARTGHGEVEVVFTPPVTGLEARQVRAGGVAGRWRVREGVQRTVVRRMPAAAAAKSADGLLVPSQADSFLDPDVSPGRYVYRVAAVYQVPGGKAYEGRPARVDVEVVEPPPVLRVAVVSEAQPHGAADIALRWNQLPPGVSLLLRRCATEPAGSVGDCLAVAEARGIGEPVAGGELLDGTAAQVTLPAGNWWLVPFTVAGNLAVRGHPVSSLVVPPVTNAEAVRNGPDVLLSWEWPEGMRLARVVWRAGGTEQTREVTLSEFRLHGGVRFHTREAGEGQIIGVVRSGADELTSSPVPAFVAAQTTPTLTFHASRVWPWQPLRVRPYRVHGLRWWCATRRIVFRSDLPCTGLRLELCVRSATGDGGSELVVRELDGVELGPDRPHEITLTLPDLSALDPPRYLGCRAANMSGPVRVNDFASTGREIRPCFR